MAIFLSHKNPASQSHWVPLLAGRITAAGAPSEQSLARWAQQGATDVLTLLRADELRYPMGEACRAQGLVWHHLPLSGRRLEASSDREGLRKMADLAALLAGSPGRSLAIHCAAGLHRTGVGLYLIMRHAGLDPESAQGLIEQIRALTAQELVRSTAGGVLAEQAESYYQQWSKPSE